MKKILIYGITNTVGGIETYLINLLKNIDNNKFAIDLLVKEKIDGINGDGIKNNYHQIHYIIPIRKHPIKAIKQLINLAKKEKYDVFHLNICDALPIIYAIPFKFYAKKTHIYVHSHNGSSSYKNLHRFFRLIVNKMADKKLACSEIAAKWMFGEKAFKNNEIILCNNFIDTDKFLFNTEIRSKIRKVLNIEDKFVIGHVGRFEIQKNHQGLIDIFYNFAKNNENVALILIGTGELEEEIKAYVKKLNLDNKVMFLGVKKNTNEYYQAMDLFILPSFFEGLPIVGIEAQASGLKCLFTDTIDKKSDITGNVEFISLDNILLWKNTIDKIAKSNYKRKNMKQKIINAGYDLNTEIIKIENLYSK